MVIAVKKFLVPRFFGRSCATCVGVAYLVLFVVVLWLIFDAELPRLATRLGL